MLFGATDIQDRDIGRDGSARGSVEPLPGLAVAAARPHRDPLGQHVGRRRDRDHRDVGIGQARRVDDSARHIDDDRAACTDVIVNRAAQAIEAAVRLPLQRELAAASASRKASGERASLSSAAEASRVTTRRGKEMLRSSEQTAFARPSRVSLPAPLGPTTRISRPGPIACVEISCALLM
jgi:hypothetical protein